MRFDVVAGHDHLGAGREFHDARHVGRAEVELRTVVGEERRVTAAFILVEDVDLGFELLVRLDRAWLAPVDWPRSMASWSMPRTRMPTLSPAWP